MLEQDRKYNCGATGLEYLLKESIGKDYEIGKIEKGTSTTKEEGCSHEGIKDFLTQEGIEFTEQLGVKQLDGQLPILVDYHYNNDGHYGVITEINNNVISIYNPAIGDIEQIDKDKFIKIWYDDYKVKAPEYGKEWGLIIGNKEKNKPYSTALFGNKDIIVPSNNPAPVNPDKDTKDVIALFIDSGGLFMDFAIQIAPQFKKVYYWTPCIMSDFADFKDALLGSGLEDEGLYRIIDMWSPKEDNGYKFPEVDLFICPDIGGGGLQYQLIAMGKWVWGSRYAENMELWRWQSKQVMAGLNMPVNEVTYATGIDELREKLKGFKDRWVKISCWRHSFETFKYIDEKQSAPRLAEIEYKHGESAKIMQFIIETPIKTTLEVGRDSYNVDGVYPKTTLYGYEIKGVAYGGLMSNKLPKQVKYIGDKMSPIWKQYGLRGNLSDEIRIEDDTNKPFQIDFCTRLGSPPNEVLSRIITNWGDIMWYGSHGILKEPEYEFKYGVLVRIFCDWAGEHWEEIEFEKSIRKWISLRKFCKINGKYYIIPNDAKVTGIGSIVGLGNSIDECIKKIEKIQDKVKGYDLDIKMNELPKLQEEIEKGKKVGIKFE
jgi:hypothetical protein